MTPARAAVPQMILILVEVAVETIRMIVVLTAIAMITIAVLTGSVTTTARADLRLL